MKKAILSAFAISLLSSHAAFSVSYTWNGSTDSMNLNTNWVGNVTPVSANTTALIFPSTLSTGNNFTPTDDFPGAFILNSMSITGGATRYVIFNTMTTTLDFEGANPTVTITGASAGQLNDFECNIAAASPALTMISTNNIATFQHGVINGPTAMTYVGGSNTGSGTDIIHLAGALTTAAGTTTLQDGIFLEFDNTQCFGTGAITFASGTSNVGAALRPAVLPLTLSQTINIDAPATFDFTGVTETLTVTDLKVNTVGQPITIIGNQTDGTLSVDGTSAITDGSMSGATSVTVTAGAILNLNQAANTYTGATNLDGASLIAGAAGALSPGSAITFIDGFLVLGGFDNTVAGIINTDENSSINLGGSGSTPSETLTVTGPSMGTDVFVGAIFENAHTGSGGLTLNIPGGMGTLQLWGTPAPHNNYFGATTVTSGTLQAGAANAFSPDSPVVLAAGGVLDLNNFSNAIRSLSGAGGNVSLGAGPTGGTLTISEGGTSYAGTITGAAGPSGISLIYFGPDILNLSGLNTYSGITKLAAVLGTLQAGAANAFSPNSTIDLIPFTTLDLNGWDNTIGGLSGTGGTVNLRTNTLTVSGGGIFAGQLTGTTSGMNQGSLTVTGGTLELTGLTNNYPGPTTITGGILQAGATNAFSPDSAVAVTAPGTLSLNNFNNTIPGLSGTGTVSLGSGRLTLEDPAGGSNTFNGSMIDGSAGGGLTLNIPSGILNLNPSPNANTYHGKTVITHGTLLAGTAHSLSLHSTIELDDNADALLTVMADNTIGNLSGGGTTGGNVSLDTGKTLTVGGNGESHTYGGVITGVNAQIVKAGSGSLTLTGTNTYTGATTVSAGFFAVNGSITSNTSVNPGAFLEGTGTITGDVIINAGGTMSPGNSIGTFTITGNYTQSNNSTFFCEINPTTADALDVSGNVTIGSNTTFFLSPDPDAYDQSHVYRIIDAGGTLSGTYTHLTLASPLLSAQLLYGANYLDLVIGSIALNTIATRGNPHHVAVALDTVFNSGSEALDPILADIFNLSSTEIVYALDQMHPAQLKAQTLVQENNAVTVRHALANHLSIAINAAHCSSCEQQKNEASWCCAPEQKPYNLWIEVMGDWLNQKKTHYSSSHQVGYDNTTAGVILGGESRFAEIVNLGLLSAYTHSDTHWKTDHGHGTIDSGYCGAYLSASGKWAYATLSTIGAWSSFDRSRNIIFPGVDTTAKSKTVSSQIISTLDLGFNFILKGMGINPFNTFDYIAQSEKGFTEKHAGIYNLTVKPATAHMLRNELGFNCNLCECSHNIRWILNGKISWVREVRIHSGHFISTFPDTETRFKVTGYMPDRSLISPGLSLTSTFNEDRCAINLNYNGLFGKNFSDNTLGADFSISF